MTDLDKRKRRVLDHARTLLIATPKNFDAAVDILTNALLDYQATRKTTLRRKSNRKPK
jgi:hypothetical protein